MLEGGPQDLLDPYEALALVALGHLEDPGLGLIENVVDAPLSLVVDVTDDLRRLLDEPAEERLVADDAGVVGKVRRRRHRVDQSRQIVEAPGGLHLGGILQLLGDGDHVDDVPTLEEPHHRPIQSPIRLAIEHGVVELLHGSRHRIAVDQHATQDGGLRLHRERRRPVEGGLGEGWRGFH